MEGRDKAPEKVARMNKSQWPAAAVFITIIVCMTWLLTVIHIW